MTAGTAFGPERILTELEGAAQLAMSEKGDCLHVTLDGSAGRQERWPVTSAASRLPWSQGGSQRMVDRDAG